MHDLLLRLVTTPDAAFLGETFMHIVGPLAVALFGGLLLAGLFGRLLFKSVTEGSFELDRRFLLAPRPADALECRRTTKLLALSRR
jgi:hypothetical protein